MALDITENGVKYLAVPVGSPAHGTALSRILALKGSPGWVAAPPSLREWRFAGITEQPSGTVLYGPWMPARPLASVFELSAADAVPLLIQLAEAFQLLKERQIPLFALQTDAVLFRDEGGVLFLPPEVIRELRGLRPFLTNRDTFESTYNPDLGAEEMVSFALGAVLYRFLTGAFPFTGESVEDIHEQMRKLEILSPAEAAPGVGDEASQFIMAALSRSRRGIPSLEEWVERLRAWRRDGAVNAKVEAPIASSSPAARKRFRRRMFWEKNWRTALIIAAVVIVLGAGLGSILKGVFAPRVTRGYQPQKIVETFYTSMNKLDQLTMGACVTGSAGKGEINEVTNLYVISRVSTGYEGRSNIVAADEWNKEGRPLIPSPQTLYGVTGLGIVQETPEPSPVFLVSYEKWTPVSSDDSTSGPQTAPRYQGQSIQDKVFLKRDRGDWVIYRIDRLRSNPLAQK
jgi:hypothetical protein